MLEKTPCAKYSQAFCAVRGAQVFRGVNGAPECPWYGVLLLRAGDGTSLLFLSPITSIRTVLEMRGQWPPQWMKRSVCLSRPPHQSLIWTFILF